MNKKSKKMHLARKVVITVSAVFALSLPFSAPASADLGVSNFEPNSQVERTLSLLPETVADQSANSPEGFEASVTLTEKELQSLTDSERSKLEGVRIESADGDGGFSMITEIGESEDGGIQSRINTANCSGRNDFFRLDLKYNPNICFANKGFKTFRTHDVIGFCPGNNKGFFTYYKGQDLHMVYNSPTKGPYPSSKWLTCHYLPELATRTHSVTIY